MKLIESVSERISFDDLTLEGLVKSGHADPHLLEERVREMQAIGALGEFVAASTTMWQPPGTPPVAAAPYSSPIAHPLGPPTISTTTFTVDLALNNPTRVVTPMVLDLTRQRFFADRAFTSAGGVTGGAVIYDETTAADLYADRDVQRVTPGTEFPVVAFSRRAPKAAEVEKWGAKFFFTDEARDRNDVGLFARAVRQLSNTVVRKINQRAIEILEAVITANARTVAGQDWSAVNTTFASGTNWTGRPAFDFAKADLQSEQEELGIDYNLWVMNPMQMFHLQGIYGEELDDLLASFGISIFVTNRVAAGVAYALAEGQVGEMRVEKPYSTESWRDPNGKEQTWVQGSVRPLMFANNPFAVLKFTGLDLP